jgi:hypothetical protein
MNKPVVFLRVASVLTLIHAVLHTVGGVFGGVDPGPASAAVTAMKANQFLLMGNMRTFWDFHIGMGLAVTIFLTGESVLMWQLASLAGTDARRLRPMIATLLLIYLAFAVNSYVYFFIAPVVTEVLIAGCIGVAFVTAKGKADRAATDRGEPGAFLTQRRAAGRGAGDEAGIEGCMR